MLQSYVKIAFRNLLKNSVYSFINIAGLAIGIASSILIMLWVADEYAYDKFHANYDRIYKLYQSQQWAQGVGTSNSMPYPLSETVKNTSSQVKHLVMTNWGEGNMLQVGDNRINKIGLAATEDFFKMFSFKMLKGDPNTALTEPTSIVITEKLAKILFDNSDPINQLIKVDNGKELKVTGVIKDIPRQSSFASFDYILPFTYFEATQTWVRNSHNNWENNSFQMYVELQPGATEADVNKSIASLIKDNNPKANTAKLFLHPMSMWRLYSNFENGKVSGGIIEYVRLFSAIAVLVLLIACINFMNLATARSESRAREVGIRKSVGSRRKELIFQFIGESVILTFIAFLIAMVMVELVLPSYNLLVNKNIAINYGNVWLWIGAIGFIIIIGMFSGSYPAFYLSSFKPVSVLKGKITVGKEVSTPRKVLVTLQFGFSIFLIIGTIVIYQQIMHVKNRDIGYDKENLMMIWTNNELETNFQTIREELLKSNAVKSICKSNSPITAIFANNEVKWQGMPGDQRVAFSTIATAYDYTETMGIKMIAGRDFSRDHKSDSTAVIVNEAAVEMMDMTEPIGHKLIYGDRELEIIGIIPNIVMDSPYHPVEAMMLIFEPGWTSTISIRLNKTDDLRASINEVEATFKKLNPSYPFEFRFADFDFDKKFANLNLISRLAGIFATLAIAITCLGLFGLAAFTAEQRTKEVGIRKVLGASVSSLIILISKDFTRLVVFGFLFSTPIAYWFLNVYLERYPYRVSIIWWVFPMAGLSALILALLIVSTQAFKAATANPTQSLRSE